MSRLGKIKRNIKNRNFTAALSLLTVSVEWMIKLTDNAPDYQHFANYFLEPDGLRDFRGSKFKRASLVIIINFASLDQVMYRLQS